MHRVLVTGHRGYIGSNLIWTLKQKYPDIKIDGLDFARQEARPGSNGVDDLCHRTFGLTQVVAATPDLEYDVIFHLAATSDVGAYNNEPFFAIQNTISGTKILQVPHKAFVFASSAAAIHSHSLYGKTKALCEDLIDQHGANASVLRLHNVCGSIPESGFYEFHNPETHLIPKCVLNDEITIFGDGSQVRDYIDVRDVCNKMVTEAGYLLKDDNDPDMRVIEYGSGVGYSVLEVVKIAQEIKGKPIKITLGDERDGDVREQISHSTVDMGSMGNSLEQSIRNVVDSYKNAGLI